MSVSCFIKEGIFTDYRTLSVNLALLQKVVGDSFKISTTLVKNTLKLWILETFGRDRRLVFAEPCQAALNVSSEGDSSTSLGNLFQCWIVSWLRLFFLYPDRISLEGNYSCCILSCHRVSLWGNYLHLLYNCFLGIGRLWLHLSWSFFRPK